MSDEKQKPKEMKKPSDYSHKVIRLMSTDIEGNQSIYSGLTDVKGISWSFSNAICNALGLDKKRRIGSLTEAEIEKLESFIKKPTLPSYLVNRRSDFDSGEDLHLIVSDLDLQKEFDIKRLKKIKSYRGLRHMSGLPSRGQRTKANFRKNRRKGSGIKKKTKVATGGAPAMKK